VEWTLMGGLRELVVARGRANGMDAVGISDATPFTSTLGDLTSRRDVGLHADMQFTYRDPERSTDPSRTLIGARSLVVGAVRYASQIPDSRPDGGAPDGRSVVGDAERSGPFGVVARYAVGDQDAVLRSALEMIATDLRNAGCRAVVLADDNALVDRAAAYRAGLGWFGKSSNLLLPGKGSWFVLGAVLTDADLTDPSQPTGEDPVPDGCGTCRRCVDACPTAAIVADGVVDARRCLSWQLQSPGTFPHEFRLALGDRIYGCDDCQEVCPPNRLADRRGDGDGVHTGVAASSGRIDVLWMLHADDDELLAAAGRWYVPKRDPDHLRRNALLVLANTGDGAAPVIAATIERYLRHPNDVLAAHAAWAALRLGRADLLEPPAVAERAAVQAEMVAAATLAPTLAPTRAVPRD